MPYGSTASGVVLQQYPCLDVPHHRWYAVPMTPTAFQIHSASTHKCMDVYYSQTGNGTKVHQWDCLGAGSLNQQFVVGPGWGE